MAEKPIPFIGPMVRAILEGRKTQTRRVLDAWCDEAPAFIFRDGIYAYDENDAAYHLPKTHSVGDLLWVREAWKACSQMDAIPPRDMSPYEPIRYEADGFIRELSCMMIKPGRFRPPMFMPRWASRLTLRVTDVRVQRLHDISQADAVAEGVERVSVGIETHWRDYSGDSQFVGGPRSSFCTLWDSLNAKRGYGWDANPWVAAYSFEVIRCNIDRLEPVST
ncbi:hypothetical protein KM176_16690 [Pseudooceanicola sp. CBS1P-1]|uniref:ASCH domain-containing protein n=1 Tax=Pseudooceanicola albus TaxID=2692189 RepID=A0A6L7G3Y7_9RHOB|nr:MULTISPECIES: hypothetical protein [Pseudooceanicola]MBT9385514.1 hypothetical protein [Pseudooceanicola endophyticus]MXN19074.1 hypothetical protein [Pseudooceanicola albus]